MTRVEIIGTADGTPAPPFYRRVVRQPLVVRLRFNLAESTPNKHAKIIGIAGFGGLVTYRRCVRGSIGDAWNIERENSDRLTGLWKRDHVILRTYPYVRGSGATTDGKSLSQHLMRVDRDPADPGWTQEVFVVITPGLTAAYWLDSFVPGNVAARRFDEAATCGKVTYPSQPRARFQWLLWSHARNGGEYLMQDERLIYEYEIL